MLSSSSRRFSISQSIPRRGTPSLIPTERSRRPLFVSAVHQQRGRSDYRRNENGSGEQGTTSTSTLLTTAVFSTVVGVLFAAPILCAEHDEDEKVVAFAEDLYKKNLKRECLDYLVKYYEKQEGDVSVPVLWRLSRAWYDVSEFSKAHDHKEERKQELLRAYQTARKAVELCEAAPDKVPLPDQSATYKWCGITLSENGQYQGNKAQIINAFSIRDHWVTALKLNPKDATCHYLLGQWAFTLASLSWLEKTVAGTLFATPPESTYEEALTHFLKAEEIDPGFYKSNTLMIAKTYNKLNKKEEAQVWLKKTLELPVNTLDDQSAHQEAKKLSNIS